jgi:hypothetical protein
MPPFAKLPVLERFSGNLAPVGKVFGEIVALIVRLGLVDRFIQVPPTPTEL